jgi:hypothetical protein
MSYLRLPLPCLTAALLAGCSGYDPKSNFTLPSVGPSVFSEVTGPARLDNKATVVVSASIAGLSCAESRIVLAQADGAGFKTHGVVEVSSTFGSGAAAGVTDLDPGTYHIAAVACRNGANVVSVMAAPDPSTPPDPVPWRPQRWAGSLASFAVGTGQVLDIGRLAFTPEKVKGFSPGIDKRKAVVTVVASSGEALAETLRLRPEVAANLHSSAMTLTGGAQPTISKCHLEGTDRALPKDGSSKLPDIVAQNPEAAPLVAAYATPLRDASRCVSESKSQDKALSAVAGAAAKAGVPLP